MLISFIPFSLTIIRQKGYIYYQIFFLVFITYLLIATLYLGVYFRSIEQLKDYFYTFSAIIIFIVFKYGSEKYGVAFLNLFYNVLLLIFIFLSIIVIYEVLTLNHLPYSRANNPYDLEGGFNKLLFIPTATFYNANDLGAHVILFFPILFMLSYFFGTKKHRYLLVFVTAVMLFSAMSRTAIAAFLLFPLFYLFIKEKYKVIFILFIILPLGLFLIRQMELSFVENTGTSSLIYNRLIAFINLDAELKTGGSAAARWQVFHDIFINFDRHFIMGKGFQTEDLYFDISDPTTANHAHSLFLELILNFGFIGTLPIIVLLLIPFLHAFLNVSKSWVNRFVIIQILYLMLVVHIPATVMRYPSIWILLILTYNLKYIYIHENSINKLL